MDYATSVKQQGDPAGTRRHERKYSIVECTIAIKAAIFGRPDMAQAGTSQVEHQNLTLHIGMRRFTRLTSALSRNAEGHACAIALHFIHCNLCRIQYTRHLRPAMAAGPWSARGT